MPDPVRVTIEVLESLLAGYERHFEVRLWDGAPVRRSPAAAALLESGFYADGDRLSFDGFPGPGSGRAS